MRPPILCTALLTVIDTWREHQLAVAHSDSRGELTVEELLARQSYEAALAELERATYSHQEEAA